MLNLQSISRGAAPAVKCVGTSLCGDRVASRGVSLKRQQSQLRRTCDEDFVVKVSKHGRKSFSSS